MLKGEDIVLLLALTSHRDDVTIRGLELATSIPRSAVHRALARLGDARLIDSGSRRVNISATEEFLLHGARYAFPARLGPERRGVPTAWAEAPLASAIRADDVLPPVWPHQHGTTRGAAVEPIHRTAINAAEIDVHMRERLTLLDGIRVGDARIRAVASTMLTERLTPTPPR